MRNLFLMLFVGGLWLSACQSTPDNTQNDDTMPGGGVEPDTATMDTTGMGNM